MHLFTDITYLLMRILTAGRLVNCEKKIMQIFINTNVICFNYKLLFSKSNTLFLQYTKNYTNFLIVRHYFSKLLNVVGSSPVHGKW